MDPRDRKPTFDILQVDFEWVKRTKSVKELRQALAALKEEGGYLELEKEIEAKLETLAPSAKRPTNSLTSSEKQQLDQELLAWQSRMEQEDQGLSSGESAEAVERKVRAEREKQKGNEHMKAKDFKLAVEAYTAAQELDPGNAVLLSNRAQAHLNLKNFQKALEDSEAAIKLDPQFIKAYHRKGKALSSMQRFAEALSCFKKVLSLDPTNTEAASEAQKCREHVPDSSFKSVAIEEDSDESGSEKSAPDELGENESVVAEGLSQVEAIKLEGNTLFQQGQFGEAIRRYEAAMQEANKLTTRRAEQVNETKAALFNNLAACYWQTEELHKVIEYSTTAVDLLQPNTVLKAKALLRRALAYEKLEKIDSAKRDMELVKSLDPGNMQASQALLRYSKALLETRQRSAARRELEVEQLIAQVDKIKDNGNKCFASEDYDTAILEFTAGIQKLQQKTSEDEELRLHPQIVTREVALFCNRAAANLKLECNAQVIQDCKAALALDKNNVKALYRLAKGHENCGQLEEALKCLNHVIEIGAGTQTIRKELENLQQRINVLKSAPVGHSHGKEKKRKVSFRADLAEEIPAQASAESPAKVVELPPEESKRAPAHVIKPPAKASMPQSVVAEAKAIATSLVSDTEAPTSATAFQTRVQSLKADKAALSAYVQKQDPQQLCGLFSQSQMDIDLLLVVFQALSASQQPEPHWLWRLLEGVSVTYRFDLTAKMLSKKDKQQVAGLIDASEGATEAKERLRAKYRVTS